MTGAAVGLWRTEMRNSGGTRPATLAGESVAAHCHSQLPAPPSARPRRLPPDHLRRTMPRNLSTRSTAHPRRILTKVPSRVDGR